MRFLKQFLIALLFVFIGYLSQAEVRKYSNEFLAIGVGARSLAMGGSVVSSSNGTFAGYWNPSRLMNLNGNIQIGLMHTQYFAGIANYNYGGLAFKLNENSALGFNYIRFGVDNIPYTLDLIDANGNINYDNISSFSATDNAFLITYARKLEGIGLEVGGNVKIINRKVGQMAKAWGFGLDIGASYKLNNLNLGVTVRDITTTVNAWSFTFTDSEIETFTLTGNDIPQNSSEITLPRILLGGNYLVTVKEKFTIRPELNFDITTDGKRNVLIPTNVISIDPKLGLELGFKNIIYLRTGVNNFQKISNENGKEELTFQPSVGLGLKIKKIQLDYALTDVGDQTLSPYSNVFSIKLNIAKRTNS